MQDHFFIPEPGTVKGNAHYLPSLTEWPCARCGFTMHNHYNTDAAPMFFLTVTLEPGTQLALAKERAG